MGWFWEIWILVLVFSSGLSLEPLPIEDNTAKCLSYVLRNENENFTQNLRISIKTDSKLIKWKFGKTVEQFLVLNDEILVDLNSNENLPYTIHTRLLFVDSFESFRFLVDSQRKHDNGTISKHQYYMAILPVNMKMANLKDIMANIINFCWYNLITNINILIEDPDGTVTVYTYYPYTKNSCKDIQPTILRRCENESIDSSLILYPDKFDNFWQCPVKSILWHEPPYVIIDQEQISGLDGQILNTLAKRMNFSIEAVISPQRFGTIYSNGTSTGSFKLLMNGSGDLMIESASCSRQRQDKLASIPYYLSPLLAIIKRPETYGSLEILILPFDWYTWLIILTLLSGKLIFQVIWRKFFKNVIPFAVNSSRLSTLSWLFAVFILTSSYEGLIFKFLHNSPRKAVPNNIEEAVRDGYKFISQNYLSTLLNEIPELKDHLIRSDKLLIDQLKDLDMLGDKYAVIAYEIEFLALRESDSFIRRNYISLQKPVLSDLYCIYMQKYSFLANVFEKWISLLLENGFIRQMYKLFVQQDRYKNEMKESKAFRNISLQQAMGAFQLLGVLLGVSTFVFVLELLSVRYQRLRLLIVSLNE